MLAKRKAKKVKKSQITKCQLIKIDKSHLGDITIFI